MSTFGDCRDEYLARVVHGKTFIDVGGLWGTVNERVSVAHEHGAISLTMLDVTPSDGDLWGKFRSRMAGLGITDYRCVSADICDPRITDLVSPADVVHCSGVLYHHPSPMLMLAALRTITQEHLVLTSCITKETIENDEGRYDLPPSGVVFVPALSDDERKVLRRYWEGVGVAAHGLTGKASYHPNDFGLWWWLPTAAALVAMGQAAGFEVQERNLIWGNNALVLLLRAASHTTS